MDYRVTLTLATPPTSDGALLAEQLDDMTEALMRVAKAAGPVVDAQAGEPNAHVTLTVEALDVTEAVNRASRLLGAALVAGVAAERVG